MISISAPIYDPLGVVRIQDAPASDIGTVREVQGRYRRPADGDLADADGTLFGWSELLQH